MSVLQDNNEVLITIDENEYYPTDNGYKKFEDYNYHKLNDLERIDPNWSKILTNIRKKYDIQKEYYPTFALKDCGGNGDCLFDCIITGILHYMKQNNIDSIDITNGRLTKEDLTSLNLRHILSGLFTEQMYIEYINNAKAIYEEEPEVYEWNPNEIKCIEDFKELIKSSDFWGDIVIINLLSEYLKINIFVFTDDRINYLEKKDRNLQNRYTLWHNINKDNYNSNYKNILLYNFDELHFNLIVHYKDSKLHTLYNTENIPLEIKHLINEKLKLII